ncbi:MAG TPA: pectinesterase family protein, partial [Puia sp.]|nr:pectinesterase family protein [Puia sp.]
MIRKSTLKFLLGWLTAALITTGAKAQFDLVVAKDGSGNFTTVQAAINAAPTGRTTPFRIFIHNGRYQETVNIPSNKPFIQLIGESVAGTIITFNNSAITPLPGGGTIGTFNSATVIINASDFSAMDITFENSFGDGSQAVALQINGDRAVFSNCRFLGNQDTLLTNGTTGLRQYFKSCYIDGNIDFIFGSAIVLFDSCIIYAKTRTTTGSSFITAANTPAGQAYGYVLRNCKIPANTGGTLYYLGRPWQNSTGASPVANNKVVYLNATLGNTIQPAGWTIWDAGTNTNLIFYGEYKSRNFSGGLTDISQRVPWSFQLADADTATYSTANLFGTWDPCAVSPNLCAFQQPPIVISNFKAIKGTVSTSFTWNISWPMAGVKYLLFRSVTSGGPFSQIGETDATTDSSVNFSLADVVPPPGGVYNYYIQASAAGETTLITDTITVSSKPTITTTAGPSSFTQGIGTPSNAQLYTVSGVNLTAGISIDPPAGYEISPDKGNTWFNNTTGFVLPQTGGVVNSDTVVVRLNATTPGTFAGNIIHASPGADTVLVPVTGNVQSTALTVSTVLMHWPM